MQSHDDVKELKVSTKKEESSQLLDSRENLLGSKVSSALFLSRKREREGCFKRVREEQITREGKMKGKARSLYTFFAGKNNEYMTLSSLIL